MSTSVQAPDLSLFPATFDASTMNDARACPVPAIADRSSPSLPSRYGPGCMLPDWMTELFHAFDVPRSWLDVYRQLHATAPARSG